MTGWHLSRQTAAARSPRPGVTKPSSPQDGQRYLGQGAGGRDFLPCPGGQHAPPRSPHSGAGSALKATEPWLGRNGDLSRTALLVRGTQSFLLRPPELLSVPAAPSQPHPDPTLQTPLRGRQEFWSHTPDRPGPPARLPPAEPRPGRAGETPALQTRPQPVKWSQWGCPPRRAVVRTEGVCLCKTPQWPHKGMLHFYIFPKGLIFFLRLYFRYFIWKNINTSIHLKNKPWAGWKLEL